MHTLDFYFDPISPYAYIAFHHLPSVLQGHSVSVNYKPILFAGILKHLGQLGPAEIPGKREWTYRQVSWIALKAQIPFQFPSVHPFNPLPILRLLHSFNTHGRVNRWQSEVVFNYVWQGGQHPLDIDRLYGLRQELQTPEIEAEVVKERLRYHTQSAITLGVFGVPTIVVNDKLFWGQDALPLVRAYLDGDPWFVGPWKDCIVPSGLGDLGIPRQPKGNI
ncbi:MAG: 2-hydroxychromene-2-carboxylate isomerase [Gammaproteobacteria bacterium]|nr:2-hydroxychromene-2-carboxylate isomerase [Gammaproteobacteria bacterium]